MSQERGSARRFDIPARESIISAMRTGVLLCVFLTAVCLADRPAAAARAAADSDSTSYHRRDVRLSAPGSYFGARIEARPDAACSGDSLYGRWGFPNPFLLRFLPGAGFGPVALAQWLSARRLRDTSASKDYYGSPYVRSEPWYSYDGSVMQTVGVIGSFVVPALLPPKPYEAYEHAQDNSPPYGHGWPYHRW
jgi:hypothetical protein